MCKIRGNVVRQINKEKCEALRTDPIFSPDTPRTVSTRGSTLEPYGHLAPKPFGSLQPPFHNLG